MSENQYKSNPELVTAIKESEEFKTKYKDSLIRINDIVNRDQMLRKEVVASISEALNTQLISAESIYSRNKMIFCIPEFRNDLESGKINIELRYTRTVKKSN